MVLYEDVRSLGDLVADFIASALARGDAAAVFATRAHAEAFSAALALREIDVEGARKTGRLALLDADDALAALMVDGMPDRSRFEAVVGGALGAVAARTGCAAVAAYGEMVDLLWAAGNEEGAVRLEEMWNELLRDQPFRCLCAYSLAGFHDRPAKLAVVCRHHAHALPPPDPPHPAGRVDPPSAHLRELAREIARRMQVEVAVRQAVQELRRTVAEREQQATALEGAFGRALLLYGLAVELMHADDENEEAACDVALEAVARALGAERVALMLRDAEGTLRWRAGRLLSGPSGVAAALISPWFAGRPPAPVHVRDVESDVLCAPLLARLRSDSIGAVTFLPLVAHGRLLGEIRVFHPRPHDAAPADLEVAAAIGHHLAAAIERFTAMGERRDRGPLDDRFSALVGRELRDALGSMLVGAQAAIAGDASRASTGPLSRVVRATERLALMIEELLDFLQSRGPAGVALHRTSVDLRALLRRTLDHLQGAEGRVVLQHVGDTHGSWDVERLAKTFSTLLAEALARTQGGSPITVDIDGSRARAVTVTIHDRATLPAATLHTFFDPRGRRDRSSALGLDLLISREVIKAHGGRVDIRANEATGTHVTVLLPRRAPR